MSATTAGAIPIEGKGLITGKPVSVRIERATAGSGVVFVFAGGGEIPATLDAVAHTDRGVTLANAQGQTLSIVEHFLCAAMLAGYADLRVSVDGAPELPILDGGAWQWLTLFENTWGKQVIPADVPLRDAVFYRHNESICLYALPAPYFSISYAVDFEHPELSQRWARWDSRSDDRALVANACTFGYLHELPAMQARGLAMGVDEHNTLGLTDSGFNRALRHADEPVYHKMLDLIGDLSLSGVNPLRMKAHVFAVNAGHGSHTAFARRLSRAFG